MKRNIILLFGLLPFSPLSKALADTPLERMLATQQAQIQQLKDQLEPVGTVVTSLLSEDKFLALKGQGWVKCDGRSVAGSRYATVSGRSVVPNCAGRFLRASGGQAAGLGEAQDFATSVRGISVPAYSGRTGSGSADIRLYSENVNTPNIGLWTMDEGKIGNILKGGGSQTNTVGAGYQNGWRDVGHTHAVDLPAQGLQGGSDETRPSNVSVNVFIRVN